MHKLSWLGALVGSIVVATTSGGETVPKNQRYCVMTVSGPTDCRFETMEQCHTFLAQGSSGNSCMLNPALGKSPMNKKSN